MLLFFFEQGYFLFELGFSKDVRSLKHLIVNSLHNSAKNLRELENPQHTQPPIEDALF